MKKNVLLLTGLLVTVAVLLVRAETPVEDGYNIGDTARDFELKNVDGKKVSLSDYKKAKGFIVVFTCNTCPYAKLYEQRIIDLDNKYRDQGFPVVAINPNDVDKKPGDSMEEMVRRSKDKDYPFPYLRDDTQEIARAYGATKTPHVYVLSNSGEKLTVEYIGAIDDSPQEVEDVRETYVADAVEALIAGKRPTIKSKRAIGCTIKWKDA